jgi:hypothetical protein
MPNINKSKIYLKSHSKKKKEAEKLLQITIKKAYYFVIKRENMNMNMKD